MLISITACILSALLLALAFPLSLPPELMQPLTANGLSLPGWQAANGFAQLPGLAFLALLPLLWVIRRSPSPAAAAGYGYLTGALWLVLHLDWIGSFGVAPVIMLTLFFSLPTALFAWLGQRIFHEQSAGLVCWGLPLAWTALEYLRSFGFWALPWNLLGYSQTHNLPLLQVADLGGVYAVSFLIVLANCLLFLLISGHGGRQRSWAHSLIGLGLICLALGYGDRRLDSIDGKPREERVRVALIQGGVDTKERWSGSELQRMLAVYEPASEELAQQWSGERIEERRRQFEDSADESGFVADFQGPLDEPQLLLVWPESCIPKRVEPHNPEDLPLGIWNFVETNQNTTLLMGALSNPHAEDDWENTAVLIRPDHVIQWVYSKVRLVAYGEVVPFRGLVRFLDYPWGSRDLTGGRDTGSFELRGLRISPMVCFDNIFSFLFMREARRGSDMFLLITNNSWYDLKNGIRQHADIDVLRAVEHRRPLARVSTTGWSHFIEPSGRISQQSSTDELATLSQWEGPSSGLSYYTRLGDLFAQLCVLATLVIGLRLVVAHRSEGWL
ncbi:MAG: apolipoprotein N-acyltransferase [bacterium]